MRYQIIGKDFPVSDNLETRIAKKFAALDKFFVIKETTECRVLIKPIRDGSFKFETTIPTKYAILRAEVIDFDLNNAIDKIVEKIEDQLRRAKTKMDRSKNREHIGKVFALDQIKNSTDKEIPVRTKSINPDKMDLDNAISKMELLGHTFFIYRDEDNNKIAVVYKRLNGGYGLIEIE
jgi:putative sigma-54 modulation protein